MGFKTRTKTCPICGAEFDTAKPNKRYCSISCREAGGLAKRIRWEANNASYHAEYMRRYRAEKKERTAAD